MELTLPFSHHASSPPNPRPTWHIFYTPQPIVPLPPQAWSCPSSWPTLPELRREQEGSGRFYCFFTMTPNNPMAVEFHCLKNKVCLGIS